MSKKLVVFCDDTWNRADQTGTNTNVFRLFQATLPEDRSHPSRPQIVHYIRGVGTRRMERIRGGGFGYGISDNIKDAYRFIVSNYEDRDEIYLFGFSRGAYTARSIAGLIRNLGILTRNNLHLVDEAYKYYKDRTDHWGPDGQGSAELKKAHTHGNETITFLGVWDTVGALGVPFGAVLGWIVDKLFKTRFDRVGLSSMVQSACIEILRNA